MLFQPKHSTFLATTAATLVLASQPMAWAAPASLGAASYDAQRRAIVVPYSGAFPTYASDKLGGPPRVYFDFNATAGFTGVPSSAVSGHPNLLRWTMAKRGNQVRLVLTFRQGANVLVLNDASRRQIVLIPQGPGSAPAVIPSAKPTAAPTTKPGAKPTTKPVAKPTATPKTRTFNQTFGQTDFRYTVGPRPAGAKRDQVTVNVGTSGITDFHVTSEPERDYVAFSISVQGKRPATPRPTPTPTPQATPEPLPTPEETPTPLPIPEESPSPAPTPEPFPTPEPSPEPVVEAPTDAGTVLSFWGNYPVMVTESSVAAASDFSLDTTPTSAQGGSFEARFGGNWAFLLGLNHLGYRVTDAQTSNQTVHQRDEYEALTGIGYRFLPFGTEEMIGLGYMARYMATDNQSVAGGSIGVPTSDTTSVLTQPSQLFHGPALFGRIDLPLLGWFGIEAKGGVAPFMLGALSAPTALEGMMGYWVTPSAYLRFGVLQLNAGYSLNNYSVADYTYARSGPYARLDLRF
jgi:hypothetical protein